MTYIKSKKIHKPGLSRGTAILSLVIIVSLFITGLIYLIQTNGVVSQTYQIREQKDYLEELEAKNQTLQVETARLQSPANLEEIAEKLGMTETGRVVYLEEEKTVAIKK